MTRTTTDTGRGVAHPLEPLTAAEIDAAVAAVRATGRLADGARFATITLVEPSKEVVASHREGDGIDRLVRLIVVPGPEAMLLDVVVALPAVEIRSWEERADARPALMLEEAFAAMVATREHPEWQAAMRRRGIEDLELVQIDPWPAGAFGLPHEEGRRIARCLSYLRADATDNGYARPVAGVVAFVDCGRGEVLEVVDTGVIPLPPERGSYLPGDVGLLRDDLRPLEITQPDGPSFTVEGNLVRWQRWSFRVSLDPHEGLVLHTLAYRDGDRARTVLHRASISEMVVPYGSTDPEHAWKNAFDGGEWGLGRMTQSLARGCDCVGEIHYFDAVLATEQGEPYVLEHAVCMHEEDYGILWKHVDLHSGSSEVRRSRRLVISNIATVGNYEYGFFWYLYLDGNVQLEVKLTGIVQTQAHPAGEVPEHAAPIAPGLAAPHHQHLFCARLDFDVDGPRNSVREIDAVAVPPGPDNPLANAFTAEATTLTTELGARRRTDAGRSRHWRIENDEVRNRLGRPVAYRLLPTMSTPTMLAAPESSVGRRAGFARYNLWVTPFAPDEVRAAGEHPNQHAGGDGLPRWTAADRSVTDTDVVVWYCFGVTHVVRPEDWPVMPVEYTGFLLSPYGFFDRNPALDVPPANGHCHT